MISKVSFAVIALSSLINFVSGHGYVQEITSGAIKYPGYNPNTDPYYNPPQARIVRKIPGNGE